MDFKDVTHAVCDISERKTPKIWFLCLAAALGGLGLLKTSILYLIWEGTGIWGLNNPTTGVGRLLTLYSGLVSVTPVHSFLRSFSSSVRIGGPGLTAFAEAMTLMAVACAGVFPGIHIGRVWVLTGSSQFRTK